MGDKKRGPGRSERANLWYSGFPTNRRILPRVRWYYYSKLAGPVNSPPVMVQ